MTRLADPKPSHCSVCYQPAGISDPQPRFVDFEAAYDGPVIPGSPENIPIDDLVICESCVKAGAELIGMEKAEDIRAEINTLLAENDELRKEVRAKDRAISHLEHTVDTIIDHPVKRPAGKPQIVGPDSQKENLKTLRSRRTMAEKISKTKKEKVA